MRSVLLLLVLACCGAHAQTTRVLFIGNSLTTSNNLPGMFAALSGAMGENVQTAMVAPAGSTFQGHTTHAATQAAIAAGPWDFVVLQEQSQLPSFSPAQVNTQVFPFATQLVQQVKAASPCAEVVFLMTWGYENGDAMNCASYPPICTYEGMQQRLRDSYVQMAWDNASWCAPAGAVWREHRALYPTLSLYSDPSHPSTAGTYIAASTLASTIFRRSCASANLEPAPLTPTQGQAIRDLASQIVLDSIATWNIGVNDPVAAAHWTGLGSGQVLFANNTVGASAQSWSFGDGSNSNDTDPLHTYATSGPFTVELVVWDACGRSDTLALVVDPATSIHARPKAVQPTVLVVREGGTPTLVVRHGPPSARLDVFDTTGRALGGWTLAHAQEQRFTLPATAPDMLVWRLVAPAGRISSGRAIVL